MRMGATHFLMKTLPKVASEMTLSVLAYNLTRAMNIVGTRALLGSDQIVSVETPLRADLEPDLARCWRAQKGADQRAQPGGHNLNFGSYVIVHPLPTRSFSLRFRSGGDPLADSARTYAYTAVEREDPLLRRASCMQARRRLLKIRQPRPARCDFRRRVLRCHARF
jgi:hypothetical protein